MQPPFDPNTLPFVPAPPPPPRRSRRLLILAIVGSVLLVCIVGFLILAEIGSHDTPAPVASHPTATTARPTPTPGTPTPTATPKPKPSPTPAPDYDGWLTSEVNTLENDYAVIVLNAEYPNGDHSLIWINTTGLNKTAANTFCNMVARDYVQAFHATVLVHFFDGIGPDTTLATCQQFP